MKLIDDGTGETLTLKNLKDAGLPDGKQCSDCAHFKRCEMLFMCPADNTMCDWSPSKFQ